MSNYWPHWAGGEPSDLPPRPGEPGYEEFIAHKGTQPDTTTAAAPTDKTAAQAGQPAPGGTVPADAVVDRNVMHGGLY